MTAPIKTLYISDLDGTLLNSDKELNKYTMQTLNSLMAKGLNFTIATARTAASTVKILSELNLNLPVILMNGVAVYDIRKEEYIKVEPIPVNSAYAILKVLKENEISGFMYALSGNSLTTYYENLSTPAMQEFHNERVRKYYKSFEKVYSFHNKVTENQIIYFCLIDEYEKLTDVNNALKSLEGIDVVLYRDIYAEDLWYLEIFSNKASKYNASKFIREYYGFDRLIGFGDNLNDIPLFKACDEGYAVTNAAMELKEVATGIIGDNNSDGVARFIYEKEEGL